MVARAFELDSRFSLIARPLLSAIELIPTIWRTLPVFFLASCR